MQLKSGGVAWCNTTLVQVSLNLTNSVRAAPRDPPPVKLNYELWSCSCTDVPKICVKV